MIDLLSAFGSAASIAGLPAAKRLDVRRRFALLALRVERIAVRITRIHELLLLMSRSRAAKVRVSDLQRLAEHLDSAGGISTDDPEADDLAGWLRVLRTNVTQFLVAGELANDAQFRAFTLNQAGRAGEYLNRLYTGLLEAADE